MFLADLAKGISVSGACRTAKVGRQTVYDLRDRDEAFKADWDTAVESGVEYLEDEARRRAVEGVQKPVYQRGFKIDTIRDYSDTLLIFLLKGRAREKYGEKVEHHGPGGGAIQHEVKADFDFDGFARLFGGDGDSAYPADGAIEPLDTAHADAEASLLPGVTNP